MQLVWLTSPESLKLSVSGCGSTQHPRLLQLRKVDCKVLERWMSL